MVYSEKNFTIGCLQGRTGANNITAYHESSIDNCIAACASYSGEGGECKGVTFDYSMDFGFLNCYLLNGTGTTDMGMKSMYAEYVGKATASSSSPPPGSSKSKAWIAGPVIGAVLLILAVLGLLWWRRNRRRQRQRRSERVEADAASEQKHGMDMKDHSTAIETPGIYEKSAGETAHLIDTPKREAPPQELPGSNEVRHQDVV